jgi:ABC-2 type transport system permease protein
VSQLAGTFPLTRLALRLDRVRLAVWIGVLAILMTLFTATYAGLFETDQEIVAATEIYISTPALRMFGLPSGATLGAYSMLRSYTVIAVLAALMSMLAVVRHTRQNEEAGRAEMIGSTSVGRLASIAATLIVVIGANIVLACAIALGMMLNGLPATSSFAAGAAVGAVGIAFGAVAAVTAQVSETSRGALGMASAILGAAFLVSAVANVLGEVSEDQLRVGSAWPAWLSPVGWGQQIRAFDRDNWWILGLFALLLGALSLLAFRFATRRDIGQGLIPSRPGPASASSSLLSPAGLVWRLQRGVFFGWAAGVAAYGAVIGGITDQIGDMLADVGSAADLIARVGGTDILVDAFFASVVGVMGQVVAVFAIQMLLRMRAEEASGSLDTILATATSRQRWMLSYVAVAALGTVALLGVAGFAAGLFADLTATGSSSRIPTLIEATLARVPSVLVLGGIAVAAFGWLPRRATSVTWGALILALVTGPMIGELLNLPSWVRNVSPFTHAPDTPATDVSAAPLIVMLVIALLLTAAGVLGFRRRDLTL